MYRHKPIVVLGANHSGTRLLVDMLKEMGSDDGESDNSWREEECFLELHRKLISKVQGKEWSEAIFDTDFIREFEDDGRYVNFMRNYLNQNLSSHYENRNNEPWHWKCPTSALFLRSWLNIYPEAYYIHLTRNSCDVAASLMRRRQVYDISRGTLFNQLMNKKIRNKVPAMKHYVQVSFESIEEEIEKLTNFVPMEISKKQKQNALACIKRDSRGWWVADKSVQRNIWEYIVAMNKYLCHLAKEF